MGKDTDMYLSSNFDPSTNALECSSAPPAEGVLDGHLLGDILRDGRCHHTRRGSIFRDD